MLTITDDELARIGLLKEGEKADRHYKIQNEFISVRDASKEILNIEGVHHEDEHPMV